MTALDWLIALLIPLPILPQPNQHHRLHGYVGGPYKVEIADLTGDGHQDIVLGYRQLGIVAVWQGNGKGGLSPLRNNMFGDGNREVIQDDSRWSEPHVHNLALSDLDGDRLPDAVLAVGGLGVDKPGRIIVVRNAGRGQFETKLEYTVPSQAKGVRLADMDKDGRLDLLYTARGSGYEGDLKIGRLYIRRGLGDWNFGPAIESQAGRSAYYVETADLNNDNYLDVVIPNEHDSCATYFINPGKVIFSRNQLVSQVVRATQIPGRRSHAVNDVRAVDLNSDGNQDLITANLGSSTISIFLGNGDGTFSKDTILEAGKNGAFLAVADFDGDRDNDFVIAHWTEDFTSVFLNNGQGRFAPRTDYRTGLRNYGVTAGDLNHDGHVDIITANYSERSVSILIGKGDGTFRKATTIPAGMRNFNGQWMRY